MSNPATVAGVGASGSIRNTWPTQVVNSTTETILQVGTDAGSSNFFLVAPTGGQIYGAQTNFNANANSSITGRSGRHYGLAAGVSNDQFSSETWNGRQFLVRISGIGNAGANASQTALVNLYQGTSATLGSDNKLGGTGTAYAMVAGGAFNFFVEATLLWDATSQILSGSYEANIAFGSGSQYTTRTVVSNVVTGVTAANLSFLATVKFGVASASNSVTVKDFVLDQV